MLPKIKALLLATVVLSCTFITLAFAQSDDTAVGSLADENAVNSYSIAFNNGAELPEYINAARSTENTVYEVGSNGKMIAAYIALKLVDEGKLSLDTKIYPLVKEELLTDDARFKEITVGHLLSHTGGFSPSFEFGVDKKIYFDPGTDFMYSGVGYIYLQSVIETVTGLSLEGAAKEYVFTPLGMNNSTFESKKTVAPYMRFSTAVLFAFAVYIASFIVLFIAGLIVRTFAKSKEISVRRVFYIAFLASAVINTAFLLLYPLSVLSKVVVLFLIYAFSAGLFLFLTRKKGKLMYIGFLTYTILLIAVSFAFNVTIPVTSDLVPAQANAAYSFKSTSEDMALFCEELLANFSGGNGAIKDMFRPVTNIDEQNSWGLGIAVERAEQGVTYWHSGINPGFQSLVVLLPERNSYIIVLTNSDNGLIFAKRVSAEFLNVDGVWDIKRP